MTAPLLDFALEYIASGWDVFPCRLDKRPRVARGFHAASRDPDQVRAWWTQWPDASIGAVVPNALAVLDIDPRHGGERTLKALEGEHGTLPTTLTCRTGGGGTHLFFNHTGEALRQGANVLGQGIDTRMPGKGYLVLPPSPHPSGTAYEWVDPKTPTADLPEWIRRALLPPPPPRRRARTMPAATGSDRYATAALDGELAAVVGAPVGARNETLHLASVRLGTLVGAGLLDEGDVSRALFEAAAMNGYVGDDGEAAARQTIRSGLQYGISHPREVAR